MPKRSEVKPLSDVDKVIQSCETRAGAMAGLQSDIRKMCDVEPGTYRDDVIRACAPIVEHARQIEHELRLEALVLRGDSGAMRAYGKANGIKSVQLREDGLLDLEYF